MNVLNNEILFKQNSKCSVSTVQFIGVGLGLLGQVCFVGLTWLGWIGLVCLVGFTGFSLLGRTSWVRFSKLGLLGQVCKVGYTL